MEYLALFLLDPTYERETFEIKVNGGIGLNLVVTMQTTANSVITLPK